MHVREFAATSGVRPPTMPGRLSMGASFVGVTKRAGIGCVASRGGSTHRARGRVCGEGPSAQPPGGEWCHAAPRRAAAEAKAVGDWLRGRTTASTALPVSSLFWPVPRYRRTGEPQDGQAVAGSTWPARLGSHSPVYTVPHFRHRYMMTYTGSRMSVSPHQPSCRHLVSPHHERRAYAKPSRHGSLPPELWIGTHSAPQPAARERRDVNAVTRSRQKPIEDMQEPNGGSSRERSDSHADAY